MDVVESVRDQFPIVQNKTFLNHAAESPLPKPVVNAIHKYVDETSKHCSTPVEWKDLGKPFFAKLINAKTGETAQKYIVVFEANCLRV